MRAIRIHEHGNVDVELCLRTTQLSNVPSATTGLPEPEPFSLLLATE